ncbi:hypothetical protein POTOM_051209 [Populus tomentosa]|uniref:Pentatricopeptide repeat-containing protein n=1 Tax=Populus tomentosa TaxID=118781 RepID=A0A8X7Y9S3_POPTO|nr:hypothetical protein POTOM_051209 [Populus tomentosa]
MAARKNCYWYANFASSCYWVPLNISNDTLINACSRFVSFEAAYSVLDRMKEACINPDVFTCNSLIAGAMRHCLLSKCMDLFEEMLELRIKADVWSYNTLMHSTFNTMLKGLCKNGFVENALVLFRNLKRHGFVPSLVTSNILINRLCKARRLKTARGYTFDGFAYCTVVGALVKTCRIEEASHYMERMVNTGIGIEMTSYNAPINLNCKVYECSGFQFNLVALNTMVDGWCKADLIDCALKIFDSMDTRDSFSHSSLIHNLCKDGRFRCASKLLLSCVRSGMSILPSTKHAVFDSLSRSGCQREAKRLESEIKLALSAFV